VLPGLLVSALSLAVVLYFVDLEKFLQALRLADYRFIGLVYLVSVVWLAVRAQVWRTLLQNKPTWRQTFMTVSEGYLLNNLLPFRLGEVARAFLLSHKTGLGFWHVMSTILIERFLDLALAAGLLLSTLPFVVGAAWAKQAALGAGGLVLAGLCFLFFLARYRELAGRIFERLFARWPRLQAVGGRQLSAFLDGLVVLTDWRRFLFSVGLMLVNWAIAVGQYYCLMLAFFPQGKPLWATFSLGVVALGAAAPSSPGALGVYELSVVGALALFQLDSSTALAMAITGHLSNYLVTGLIGAFALAQDGQSLVGLFRQLRQLPSAKA